MAHFHALRYRDGLACLRPRCVRPCGSLNPAAESSKDSFVRAEPASSGVMRMFLRLIRQKTLAKLRRQIEPVDHSVYGRFLPVWHRIGVDRKGPEALLEVIGQIQGYSVPASVLEDQILRARIPDYDPRDLDTLMSSGVLLWGGVEALGPTDGRVALYLTENAGALLSSGEVPADYAASTLHLQIREYLATAGASFSLRFLPVLVEAFEATPWMRCGILFGRARLRTTCLCRCERSLIEIQ